MMRTKLYNLIVCTVYIVITSCTNQDIIEHTVKPIHSNTLNVTTEKQDSRSILNYEGTFYWTENDYIGVYGEETENARFHFTSQADGMSVFTGNMNVSGETIKWAYFPYSEEVEMDADKNQLSFPMPAERTISNENHSPMIGRIETNNTVLFYHTGGILLLKMVGLPKNASQLVITSEGKNSPCLAGTAVIDDINVDGCTYRIENGCKEVIYDVRNLEGDGYVYSIYMPLQVGTYEKIKVTLKNEVGAVIKERSLSNLVVTRGKMTNTPTLNFSDKIYAYELPEECFLNTEWDGAYLFSNELFVSYQTEELNGRNYMFSDVCSSEDDGVFHVQFNEKGELTNMIIGECLFFFYNHAENNVDVTIMYDGKIEEYTNQSLPQSRINSRAGVEGAVISDLVTVYGYIDLTKNLIKPEHGKYLGRIMPIVDMGLGEAVGFIGQDELEVIVGTAAGAMTGAIIGAVTGAAAGGVGAIPGAIVGAATGALTAFVTSAIQYRDKKMMEMLYTVHCGKAQIETIEPKKELDSHLFKTGYILSNTGSVIFKQHQKCGLLVKKVANWRTLFDTPRLKYNGANVIHYNVQSIEEAENKTNFPIFNESVYFESGYTYYIRAFIAVGWKGNPACYYSDMKKITFDDAKIDDYSVQSVNYQNGKIYIKFNVQGKCFDDSDYNMILTYEPIFRSSNFSLSKKWNKENSDVEFNVELDRKFLIYSFAGDEYKDIDGCFKVSCTRDGSSEIIDYEFLFPHYDKEPSIDLDVRIIDGPRKVGGSRAANEEELYYIKYEVTTTTKGSGWIQQVVTKSSDGKIAKKEKPLNEEEEYKYTGSKTYKTKAELPTITAIITLPDGTTKEKQVSVASLLN